MSIRPNKKAPSRRRWNLEGALLIVPGGRAMSRTPPVTIGFVILFAQLDLRQNGLRIEWATLECPTPVVEGPSEIAFDRGALDWQPFLGTGLPRWSAGCPFVGSCRGTPGSIHGTRWLAEPPDKGTAMNFNQEFPDESRQKRLEPAEFCGLLLSRRQLVRCHTVGGGVLGLLDLLTDEIFQVEESTLDRWLISS